MTFSPRIFVEFGSLLYEDGRVLGCVQVSKYPDGKLNLVILDWESEDPGKGHTIEALTWLRERYDVISAVGIGSFDEDGVGDISIAYWEHMKSKGLVDELILDNGKVHLPSESAPAP